MPRRNDSTDKSKGKSILSIISERSKFKKDRHLSRSQRLVSMVSRKVQRRDATEFELGVLPANSSESEEPELLSASYSESEESEPEPVEPTARAEVNDDGPPIVTISDSDDESDRRSPLVESSDVDEELLNALLGVEDPDRAGSPRPWSPPPEPPRPIMPIEGPWVRCSNAGRVYHIDENSPGVTATCDVDSYVIMASDLSAFVPPLNFSISLENPHAMVCKNKKAIALLNETEDDRPDGPPRYRFLEFVFGGYGPETIYVLYRIEIKSHFREHFARWKFHKNTTLEAISAMPRLSRTRSHTPSKIHTFGKTQLRIYHEDWEAFAGSVYLTTQRTDGVRIFYYRSLHGLKLEPELALNEIDRLVANYNKLYYVQVHHGVEFAKDRAMITFDLKKIRKMTDSATWESATTYTKYFFLGGYGHFSGMKRLRGFDQVTYVQGYEPEAHLLPNKRGPPTWMRQLFNGMKMAPHGNRLSVYGGTMANDEAKLHEYFKPIAEVGVAARFEAVCTYSEVIWPRMRRDVDIGKQFSKILYDQAALVEITDFADIVRCARFGTESLIPSEYKTMPYPQGCLLPRQHLECVIDLVRTTKQVTFSMPPEACVTRKVR